MSDDPLGNELASALADANLDLSAAMEARLRLEARVRELENTLEWTQKERDALKYSAPERGPWASAATQLVHESRMRQEAESRLAEAKAEAHQLGVNLHLERQRVRELTEWRPMESAPDAWVLAHDVAGGIAVVRRFHDGWFRQSNGRLFDALRWLPLPQLLKETE